MNTWRHGLSVTLAVCVLWLSMAVWRADTTFHLAPALVTASWAVAVRWQFGKALPRSHAAVCVAGGTVAAVAATTVLVLTGRMSGPDVLGGAAALTETFIVIAAAIPITWWAVGRQPRSRRATEGP